MKTSLVIFDFDGTITNRDSMLEFTKFHCGLFRYWFGMLLLSPILIAYKLGWVANWRAKEYFLAHFFGSESLSSFQQSCDQFGLQKLPSMIRPAAVEKLREYQRNGAQLVVVSSSAENWISAWCRSVNVPVIGTRLEIKDQCISGKLDGLNCYGPEKVKRLKAHYELDGFEEVIAYGDSKGDYQLFQAATNYYYKPFRH